MVAGTGRHIVLPASDNVDFLEDLEGAQMIAYILIFLAGAFCGSVVMAFFIGARMLNAKCDEWERRY